MLLNYVFSRRNALITLLFFLYSCSNNRIYVSKINDYFVYTEITHPFYMRIIEYEASISCGGGRAYASVCIGKTKNNDTIRVLSLCNTDTTFSTGQMILVDPQKRPKFPVLTPLTLSDSSGFMILQRNNYKTIYGSMKIVR